MARNFSLSRKGEYVAKKIKEEVVRFANDFWSLPPADIASLADQIDLTYSMSDIDAKGRENLTNEYIQDTYARLVPVVKSVQEYFVKKAQKEASDAKEKALKYYQSKVTLQIHEIPEENLPFLYAGYSVQAQPLGEGIDQKEWTIQLDEEGNGYKTFSIIEHLLAGSPDTVAIYDGTSTMPVRKEKFTFNENRVALVQLSTEDRSVHDYYFGLRVYLDPEEEYAPAFDYSEGEIELVVFDPKANTFAFYDYIGVDYNTKPEGEGYVTLHYDPNGRKLTGRYMDDTGRVNMNAHYNTNNDLSRIEGYDICTAVDADDFDEALYRYGRLYKLEQKDETTWIIPGYGIPFAWSDDMHSFSLNIDLEETNLWKDFVAGANAFAETFKE